MGTCISCSKLWLSSYPPQAGLHHPSNLREVGTFRPPSVCRRKHAQKCHHIVVTKSSRKKVKTKSSNDIIKPTQTSLHPSQQQQKVSQGRHCYDQRRMLCNYKYERTNVALHVKFGNVVYLWKHDSPQISNITLFQLLVEEESQIPFWFLILRLTQHMDMVSYR